MSGRRSDRPVSLDRKFPHIEFVLVPNVPPRAPWKETFRPLAMAWGLGTDRRAGKKAFPGMSVNA